MIMETPGRSAARGRGRRDGCLGMRAAAGGGRSRRADDGRGQRVLSPRGLRTRSGDALDVALFAELEREDIRTIVAGVTLPNPASLGLHERFGFRPVGVFHEVGRKFDQFWDVAWFERPLRPSDRARS